MPYGERRDWLAALGLVVSVRPAGCTPRYQLSLGIPLPDGTEHRITFDGRRIVGTSTSIPRWGSRSTHLGSASAASARPAS
jgi:hypothetical protein